MATTLAPTAPRAPRRYWEAQGLAELVLSEFGAAVEQQDEAAYEAAATRHVLILPEDPTLPAIPAG